MGAAGSLWLRNDEAEPHPAILHFTREILPVPEKMRCLRNCRDPKFNKLTVFKIQRIFRENGIKQLCVVECLYLLIICDEPRRPRRGAPAADQCCIYLQTPHCPAVPRRGPEAGFPPEIAWFNNFHNSNANSRSCMFLMKIPPFWKYRGVLIPLMR